MVALILGGIGFASLLLVILLLATLRKVVPTNMVDIVQSARKTVSFGTGQEAGNVYYQIPSFVPVWGVVVSRFAVSNFQVKLDNYAAYDSGRLPFVVDVVAFFQIFDSDMAAKRVSSFNELMSQLQEILRGSVRRILAEHKLEEVLGMRSELGDMFTKEVDDNLKAWGVRTVKTIEFMDMRDSPESNVIHNIMAKDQARIDRESRVAIAENTRQAETAEIESQREIDLREQEARERVGQRTAEANKTVGIAEQLSQQEVLSAQKNTTEREMEVQQVKDVRAAEIARQVAEVEADQARKVMVVNADAERQRLTTVAEGELEAARRDAEGVRVKGEAEGRAKEAINQADVTPQILLAKEIGENLGYQEYLVRVRRVEAEERIGVAQADALKAAEMKVVVTGGSAQDGILKITDLLSPKGGALLGAALEGMKATTDAAQTPTASSTPKKISKAKA